MYSTVHFTVGAVGGLVCIVVALLYAALSARKSGAMFYGLIITGLALCGIGLWILSVRDLLFMLHALPLASTAYRLGVIVASAGAAALALAVIEHVTIAYVRPERRSSKAVRIATIATAVIVLLLLVGVACVSIWLHS